MQRTVRILLAALMLSPMISIPTAAFAGETRDSLLLRLTSNTVTVLIEFDEDEMRLKTKEDGSQVDKTVQALYRSATSQKSGRFAQFPKVPLPLTQKQLPRNVAQIVASFRYVVPPDGAKSSAVGGLTLSKTHKNGPKWTYLQAINQTFAQPAGATPVVKVADLDRLKLSVTVRRQQDTVWVGVGLLAGDAALFDIRRDGKSVPVAVRLLDGKGKEIASKNASLNDFGFG